MRRQIMLELTEPDDQLLRRIADHLGIPRVQVLRWALRFYALSGPWPQPGPRTRITVIGRQEALTVGPKREELTA